MPLLDFPLTAVLGRKNEASLSVRLISCYYTRLRTARCVLLKEWKAYCCIV